MDSVTINENQSFVNNDSKESKDLKDEEATETFQNFLCELFEKKGVLNDLRAYLRGQIVNVLRCARAGDPSVAQRHLSQRLDSFYQALNILIAEYLLSLEFSYTLSVFVSEIPLAQMTYDFSKTLLKNTAPAPAASAEENTTVKFSDKDVWTIINNLDLKCDSNYLVNVMQMYHSEKQFPLLICILKCSPLRCQVEENNNMAPELSLLSSSSESAVIKQQNRRMNPQFNQFGNTKCVHYDNCASCKSQFMKLVDYYKKKNQELSLTLNQWIMNSKCMDILKNLKVVERDTIKEILEQLKAAYSNEIRQMKEEEERQLKRYIANHSLILQKRQEELEESFKNREADLIRNVLRKKKFLWGVARVLRDQHERMARAMLTVKAENKRLIELETNLRNELTVAQESLKKHAEGMREEIANELRLMEKTLQSMKKERCEIEREKAELEHLKNKLEKNIDSDKDYKYYELLKKEISELKFSIESMKCEQRAEVAVMTQVKPEVRLTFSEINSTTTACISSAETQEGYGTVSEKFKDNFGQMNKEKCDLCDEVPHVGESTSAAVSRTNGDELMRLKEENVTLRRLAQQQSDRIEHLCGELSELSRNPARSPVRRNATAHESAAPFGSMGVSMLGGRNGGGEALCVYANAAAVRPRVALPGDSVPFIGMLQDNSHSDARRHIINQWRALRRRYNPQTGRTRPTCGRYSSQTDSTLFSQTSPEKPACSDRNATPCSENNEMDPENLKNNDEPNNIDDSKVVRVPSPCSRAPAPSTSISPPSYLKSREKSPQAILREAKQKLKNKKFDAAEISKMNRDKSPSSVLREAKMRLRKLEMESDAANQSFLDFKKRQTNVKDSISSNTNVSAIDSDISNFTLRPSAKVSEDYNNDNVVSGELDVNKYYQNYSDVERNLSTSRCNSMIEKIKATYECYFTRSETKKQTKKSEKSEQQNKCDVSNLEKSGKVNDNNYLEKPLSVFRNLYYTDLPPEQEKEKIKEYETEIKDNRDAKEETEVDDNKLFNNADTKSVSHTVLPTTQPEEDDTGDINDTNDSDDQPSCEGSPNSVIKKTSTEESLLTDDKIYESQESKTTKETNNADGNNDTKYVNDKENKSYNQPTSTQSENNDVRIEYDDMTADVDNYYRCQSDLSLAKLAEEDFWE